MNKRSAHAGLLATVFIVAALGATTLYKLRQAPPFFNSNNESTVIRQSKIRTPSANQKLSRAEQEMLSPNTNKSNPESKQEIEQIFAAAKNMLEPNSEHRSYKKWQDVSRAFFSKSNSSEVWLKQWASGPTEDKSALIFLFANGSPDNETVKRLAPKLSDYASSNLEKLVDAERNISSISHSAHSHIAPDQELNQLNQELRTKTNAIISAVSQLKEDLSPIEGDIKKILSNCSPQQICNQATIGILTYAPNLSKTFFKDLQFKNHSAKEAFDYAWSTMPHNLIQGVSR